MLLRARGEWAFYHQHYIDAIALFGQAAERARAAGHILLAQICDFGKADGLLILKQYDEACAKLESLLAQGIASNVQGYEALLRLGWCLLHQQEIEKALDVFQMIHTELQDQNSDYLRPQRAQALFWSGVIQSEQGNKDIGIKHLQDSLALWKTVPGSIAQQKTIQDELAQLGIQTHI